MSWRALFLPRMGTDILCKLMQYFQLVSIYVFLTFGKQIYLFILHIYKKRHAPLFFHLMIKKVVYSKKIKKCVCACACVRACVRVLERVSRENLSQRYSKTWPDVRPKRNSHAHKAAHRLAQTVSQTAGPDRTRQDPTGPDRTPPPCGVRPGPRVPPAAALSSSGGVLPTPDPRGAAAGSSVITPVLGGSGAGHLSAAGEPSRPPGRGCSAPHLPHGVRTRLQLWP